MVDISYYRLQRLRFIWASHHNGNVDNLFLAKFDKEWNETIRLLKGEKEHVIRN